VRGRRKKSKKASSGQSQNQTTQIQTQTQNTAVITTHNISSLNVETEVRSDDSESSVDGNKTAEPTKLVTELLNEVNSLKGTVKTLQNQLEFVLSFLGIMSITDLNSSESSQSGLSAIASSGKLVANSSANDAKSSMTSSMSSTSQPLNGADGHIVQTSGSYADIARKSATLSAPLRNAVVSAVYADFEEKDRRAKNVVISGLPISSRSDKLSVEKLCERSLLLFHRLLNVGDLGSQGRVTSNLSLSCCSLGQMQSI